MTFYEQELRKIIGEQYPDATYVGRACYCLLYTSTPLVVVLALLTYFKESRRADELCKARMELVEGELPRFVATLHQELAASRAVLRILENYKKHAGPCLLYTSSCV